MAVPTDPPGGLMTATYRVIASGGVHVRASTSSTSRLVRTAVQAETLVVSECRRDEGGKIWLRIDGGWLRERTGSGEESGALQVIEVDALEACGQSCRVVARSGIIVRSDFHPTSTVVRTAACGEILEVRERKGLSIPGSARGYSRSLHACSAIMRLHVADGWVSERSVSEEGLPGELLVEPVAQMPRLSDSPAATRPCERSWHRVLDPDGLVVHDAPDPHSEPVRTIPCGELVEVREHLQGCQWALVAGGWAMCEGPSRKDGERGCALLSAALPPPEGRGVFWYQVVAPFLQNDASRSGRGRCLAAKDNMHKPSASSVMHWMC